MKEYQIQAVDLTTGAHALRLVLADDLEAALRVHKRQHPGEAYHSLSVKESAAWRRETKREMQCYACSVIKGYRTTASRYILADSLLDATRKFLDVHDEAIGCGDSLSIYAFDGVL